MKARVIQKSGASAKRWRGFWRRLSKGSVDEVAPEAKQETAAPAGVHCCSCGKPIPEQEWAVSKWGEQYICEKCYYQEEFVAMRVGLWGDLEPPKLRRRAAT